MKYAVITDAKYRSAISAAKMLSDCGFSVIVTQTKKEAKHTPPVFFSKYVYKTHVFDLSVKDNEYKKELLSFLSSFDFPLLFCIGADTLYTVSKNKDEFSRVCSFTVSDAEVLDKLNDKSRVLRMAKELSLPVPYEFDKAPERYPVIVKPVCGEKLSLSAKERYKIAQNEAEYNDVVSHFSSFGMPILVQEKVQGEAMGVSLLMDDSGKLVSALCHRRVREYPILGGPSCCCESFYDEKMVNEAYSLLSSFGFCGLAMVEFKGKYILEVNPRVWGSFPLVLHSGSDLLKNYARISQKESVSYIPQNYKIKRMRFILNDTLCALSLLSKGRIGAFFAAVKDAFFAKEAIFDKKDAKVFFAYLKNSISGR